MASPTDAPREPSRLPPATLRPFPRFPGFWKAIGPGIVWLALAQGSSELIWWPYLIARYGLAFLCLLVPACLLQLPVNYQIGSYTLLTGESIFRGFIRLHRGFALALWVLFSVSFLWFGAFASAGGTALAALTEFPASLDQKGRTLFWAYASMAVFFTGLALNKAVYRLIERLLWVVSIVTLLGLIVSCLHPDVRSQAAKFATGVFSPSWPAGRSWDPQDSRILLTAIAFAGLGGFWTLFYSYWLREKGVGMAAYAHEGAGPIDAGTGLHSAASGSALPPLTFSDSASNLAEARKWKKQVLADSSVGIFGNIATTLLTCLLAYAVLFPTGEAPAGYELAVVQAKFFESSLGAAGRILFLGVAACFLADTWVATLDAVSRVHADFLPAFFPRFRATPPQRIYRVCLFLFTAVTAITVCYDEPGAQIQLTAVIGLAGTVSFSFAFLFISTRVLPKLVPRAAVPGKFALASMAVAAMIYAALAILYFGNVLGVLHVP